MEPKVFDLEGVEKDWEWVTKVYGSLHVRAEVSPGDKVYRLVEVIEREGASTEIVTVLDEAKDPLIGVSVARYWPGAPELIHKPASPWKGKAVIGKTNDRGDVGFGMGRGDYIKKAGAGASAVWVADKDIPSDLADKLGMIAGTNHRRLDFVFQLTEEPGGDHSPTAPAGDLTKRVTNLEANLAQLADNLPAEETIQALQDSLDSLHNQLSKIETALDTVRQALSKISE